MSNFITRTISGIIFVAIMVAGMAFNGVGMTFLFTLITSLAAWEFTGLVNEHRGADVNRFITTVAASYLYLAFAGYCSGLTPSAVFIPYLLTIVYLFVSELYLKHKDPIATWAYTMLTQLYVALPLAMVNVLGFTADPSTGKVMFTGVLPLCVFVFLWMNDTGAYCIGSLLGRHKLFPRVSPGKSWEGSVGGAVIVLIVAYVASRLTVINYPLTVAQWLGLGLTVVVFGTWGDLVESLFKRTIGIKDSGNVLPGHGGMLDRFDSSLMALPAAVVYLYTLSFI